MSPLQNYAWQFIGIPYVWGGNDTAAGGMDCSGFALELLRFAGIWSHRQGDASAQDIYNYLLTSPHKRGQGKLLFFGQSTSTITHVALEWADPSQMIEAGGGGPTGKKGMIRIRPKSWRKDLVAEVLI